MPLGAGQRIRPWRRRQRVFHAGQPPDAVALDIQQHRRPGEIERAGGHARGREHGGLDVHEVIAVTRLHAADLHESVGAGAGDIAVLLGRSANLGEDLVG